MVVTGLLLGLVFGFVLQRGRFCVTGMLRDIFTQRTWRGITALFIVIAVSAVGTAALTSAGMIAPEVDPFAPVAVIVGGFVFGIGIMLSAGCASGTWYRAGEGLVGSWLALASYALSASMMKTGPLRPLDASLKHYRLQMTTLQDTLGVSVWWLAVPFAAFVAYLAWHFTATTPRRSSVATLRRPWYQRPLGLYPTAVLVGLIGVAAWPLSSATGRNDGLGITSPSKNVLNYLFTGDTKYVDWGMLLVVGLLLGAMIGAKISGEFRVRVPDSRTATRALVGGLCMGVGASWAGGCTVGNGMVQTSLFSYQGWIGLLAMGAGVGAGAAFLLRPQQRTNARIDAPSAPQSKEPAAPGLAGYGVAVATGLVGAPAKPKAQAGLRELGQGRYALDTLGAVCPFPLIEAKQAMAELLAGETLVIDFDCTQATESIPQWAADEGYAVTEFEQTGDAGWRIAVRKPELVR